MKLHDVVRLKRDWPEYGLQAGTLGAIVDEYNDAECEVEFVDSDGQTLALVTVSLEALEVVTPRQE